MAKEKAVSLIQKTPNGRTTKARCQKSNSKSRASPLTYSNSSSSSSLPTDWLSAIGQSDESEQQMSNGTTEDAIEGSLSSSSSPSGSTTWPRDLQSGSQATLSGSSDVVSPNSGMKPKSFYGQKLSAYAFSFQRSPYSNHNGNNGAESVKEEPPKKSVKRKLKTSSDSNKSKQTGNSAKKIKKLSVPLCDVMKNSPSPRSSPVFMIREKNGIEEITSGNSSIETPQQSCTASTESLQVCSDYSSGINVEKVSQQDDSKMSMNGNLNHNDIFEKSSPENKALSKKNKMGKQSPSSIIEEVMFDLGSVCSEGSITSGFGSVNSGVFIKEDNGDYVFSSNSASPELVCNGLTTSPSNDSDRSYSPSISSETGAERSPELQTSITKFFKSSMGKQQSSPKETKKNGAKNSTPSGKGERSGKKQSGKGLEQMHLDLGQRNFGHVTCHACGMVYTCAQPDDEAAHIRHHKKFVSGLKFNGWKNERIVHEFHDGRIIVVNPDDHPFRLKKVEEIRTVVDMELGFADMPLRKGDSKTFLFIANKKVVGCCVATHIDKGYPVLPSTQSKDSTPEKQIAAWCCSTNPVPAQCGISRIWVWRQCRRTKIATRLIDCVRSCFIYGCTIPKDALAFSDPTPDGKRLATSYIGTPEFLVFR